MLQITKQESQQLRREISQLGQLNILTVNEEYMPSEIGIQQALQEGLSIITNPTTLDFRHTKAIYIKPQLNLEDEEEVIEEQNFDNLY